MKCLELLVILRSFLEKGEGILTAALQHLSALPLPLLRQVCCTGCAWGASGQHSLTKDVCFQSLLHGRACISCEVGFLGSQPWKLCCVKRLCQASAIKQMPFSMFNLQDGRVMDLERDIVLEERDIVLGKITMLALNFDVSPFDKRLVVQREHGNGAFCWCNTSCPEACHECERH